MGATEEQIQQRLGHLKPDDDCEVLEENMPIVHWFIQVHNDGLLKYVGSACLGLDVQAIQSDLTLSATKRKPNEYQGLKLMARVYSNELYQQKAKQQ
ncbi:hypothetical protein [uncultured Paraglaciecola sp.]|uniref:hypothetical protein n=1 Tax=uncultured Paraglaciecola sp. TaxID=1765024 RepID=UPI0026050026|nr:hypothetical protein [uncultured Paraglaciecola sp.]